MPKRTTTVPMSFRLMPRHVHFLHDLKDKPPFPETDADALRLALDLAAGKELTPVVAGLAPSPELRIFHADVMAIVRSVQNLRSAIAGNLDPEVYDEEIREVVEELRKLAIALPDQLGSVRDRAHRMAELLGSGLSRRELNAMRAFQGMMQIRLDATGAKLTRCLPGEKPSLENYYEVVGVTLEILARLFGPPEAK